MQAVLRPSPDPLIGAKRAGIKEVDVHLVRDAQL
jgi:hypothetical protein